MNIPITPSSKIRTSLAVSFFLVSTIGLFGPVMIYLTNTMEFSFSFHRIAPPLLLVYALSALALSLCLLALPARGSAFHRAVAILGALGVALWLQGNILVWRYGFVDGRDVDWGAKALYGWIDTPIWIVLLGSALFAPHRWARHAGRLSAVFLLIQLVATAPFLARIGEEASFKEYSASEEGVFDFSTNTNVILLIVDCVQSDVFQEILAEDPTYGDAFDGFTYFRNTLGGYPTTYGAISHLLTEQVYLNQEPYQDFLKRAFLSDCSIPKVLLENGIRVDLHPLAEKTLYYSPQTLSNLVPAGRLRSRDVAYLYGLTLFRYAPHFLKPHVHGAREWAVRTPAHPQASPPPAHSAPPLANAAAPQAHRPPVATPFPAGALQFPDIRFAADMRRRATATRDEPVFKFYHRMGAHAPVLLDEHLEYGRRPFNRDTYKGFVKATLQWLHVCLDTLQQAGIYENSLIIITSDHGYSDVGLGVRMPNGEFIADGDSPLVPEHVRGSAIPLLLVKPMQQQGDLHTSDAPASLGDIPATVFAGLGLQPAGEGLPLFEIPETALRPRRFYHYQWTHSTWKKLQFPPITEYEVTGFSWDPASWRPTGRVFREP